MRKFKKGFTIVELVIVIAVIAVLTAVLVPTFIHLTNKANKASDQSLVTNLNKALAIREAEQKGKKPETMHEAVTVLHDEFGYGVEKLVTKSDEKLVYDLHEGKFYLDGSDEFKGLTYSPKDRVHYLWRIKTSVAADEELSVYAGVGFIEGEGGVVLNGVGFDAGSQSVSSVKYLGVSEARDVVIRTNHGETALTVEAAADTVNHFGNAGLTTIKAIATSSYHLFGSVQELKVTASTGRVVLENSSIVVDITGTVDDAVTLIKEETATVLSNSANAQSGEQGHKEPLPVATEYVVNSAEELAGFRDYVNAGVEFDIPVVIKKDIDLSKMSWMPIGTAEHPFHGTISGNNHKIIGLTNGTLTSTKDAFTTLTTKSYGSAYGLIGLAGAPATGKTLVVKDLSFENVNIKMPEFGNCVGALLGYAMDEAHFVEFEGNTNKTLDKVELSNVKVLGGVVSGNNNVGGLIGKSYASETKITNCSNAADVTSKYNSSSSRAAGILAFTNSSILTITGSSNSGTVSAGLYVTGIVGLNWKLAMNFVITSNSNSGQIISTNSKAENGKYTTYIVNCSSGSWSKAASGAQYNFGSDSTANVNTAPAVSMPNAGNAVYSPVLVQLGSGAQTEANGTSANK